MLPWLPIPRRCPVDDSPHTTCVSADYDPSKYPPGAIVVVPIVRSGVLDATIAELAAKTAIAPDPPQPMFSTASYRRTRRR